jgi:hypothetical protein
MYYSLSREELQRGTALNAPLPASPASSTAETLESLAGRLGPNRPILARIVTPPLVVREMPEWRVVKIVVPGLQPLHGDHLMPHLGGPLWQGRSLSAWGRARCRALHRRR